MIDRDKMVTENMGLVYKVAHETGGRLPLEDMVQEGAIGLMQAIDKFEPERGHQFSTYALWWIKQAIYRASHLQSRMIRLPVHAEDLLSTKRTLEKRLRREVSIEELAKETCRPVKGVKTIVENSRHSLSLDFKFSDEEDNTFYNIVGDDGLQEEAEEQIDAGIVNALIDFLPERSATVLRKRYGIGCKPMTLDEVGEDFGRTRERIRQIQVKAEARLKRLFQRWRENRLLPHEIKKLRERLGLTKAQLARKIKVNPQSVANWENGVNIPKPTAREKLRELQNDHILPEAMKYPEKKESISLGPESLPKAEDAECEDPDCDTCSNRGLDSNQEPCITCVNAGGEENNWEEAEVTDEELHCTACHHNEKTLKEEPCNSCDENYSNFIPASPSQNADKLEHHPSPRDRILDAMNSLAEEAPNRDRLDFLAELVIRVAELLVERGWR